MLFSSLFSVHVFFLQVFNELKFILMLFGYTNSSFLCLDQVVKKTFIGEGEGKKAPNQVAGEILSFFTRNNFVVSDRGDTIV